MDLLERGLIQQRTGSKQTSVTVVWFLINTVEPPLNDHHPKCCDLVFACWNRPTVGKVKYDWYIACEPQTYFRSSLLSLRKREGEKRRPEIREGEKRRPEIHTWGREATTGNTSAVLRLTDTGLSLRFQVAEYMQLVGGELNSQGVLLVSSFFCFPTK